MPSRSLWEALYPYRKTLTTDAGETYYYDFSNYGADPEYALSALIDEGFTYSEIAAETGITENILWSWYILPGQGVFEGKRFWPVYKDKIKAQLKQIQQLTGVNFAGSMDAEWHFEDLAKRIAAFDAQDLRDVAVRQNNSGGVEYYNKRNNVVFKGIGENQNGAFASTHIGSGYSWYLVQFTNTGVPIFTVKKFKNASILPAFIGLALAFVGVPALIGNAVLGTSLAATYPTLASAIGNVAIQTALNGGDIEASIKTGVASLASGFAGTQVTSYTSFEALGTITSAVTKAALLGQDIDKAALLALGKVDWNMSDPYYHDPNDYIPFEDIPTTGYDFDWDNWGQNIPNFLDQYPDWGNWNSNGDWIGATLGDLGLGVDPNAMLIAEDYLAGWGLTPDALLPDANGALYTVAGDYVQLDPATWAAYLYFDESFNVRDASNNIIMTADEGAAAVGGATDDEAANNAFLARLFEKSAGLSGTMLTAQPPTGARPATAPTANGQSRVPTIDNFWAFAAEAMKLTTSYLVARKQIERTGYYRPTYQTGVGTPYPQVANMPVQRPDGTTVVNNGNGTITTTYPNGQTITTAVNPLGTGSIIPGVSNTTLMIGAAAAVGIVLLAKR